MNNIKNWIVKNKFLLLIFLVTIIFFIVHRLLVFSWDYAVYLLNAKHIFNNGFYFEILRPPLVSFILGVFGNVFGYTLFLDIFYIIFVSVIFLAGVYLLTKELKLNTFVVYAMIFTPFMLSYAMFTGTELLFLALILFAIYFIVKNSFWAGLFLGLSALTRYTGIVFVAFIFLIKGWKNKFFAFCLYFLSFLPWFIFNKIRYGNFFTSIADQYYQNIVYRLEIIQPARMFHFIIQFSTVLSVLLSVVLIFLLFNIIRKKTGFGFFKQITKSQKKALLIIIVIGIYTIYSYLTTPLKDARYLFLLVLPIVSIYYLFFAYFCSSLKLKYRNVLKKSIVFIFLIVFLINLYLPYSHLEKSRYATKEFYEDTKEILESNNLSDCLIVSNYWVFLNGVGLKSIPLESNGSNYFWIDESVIVIYKFDYDKSVLDNSFKKEDFLYEDASVVVIGKKCKTDFAPNVGHRSFLEQINELAQRNYGYSVNTNACMVIFNNHPLFEKICNFVNFNGFKIDDNRDYRI